MHPEDADGMANSLDLGWIRLQTDLNLHCFLRPVCPKTLVHSCVYRRTKLILINLQCSMLYIVFEMLQVRSGPTMLPIVTQVQTICDTLYMPDGMQCSFLP